MTAFRSVPLLALALVLGSCGWTPGPARRSIVLITVDTLRADRVDARRMPALDRLARQAIAFDTAISVGPLTLPGHASLLTGRYPPAHGVRDNHLFTLTAGAPTFTNWLRGRGYATGAFVSAIVLDRRYGLDAGFDTYDDAMGGAPERSASDTLQRAGQWLSERLAPASDGRPPKPVFLWVHLFEPHAPYLSGSYDGELAVVDRELDRFFAQLRERGLWDDVVLSVTSDHGESLGEHGEKTHGFFVYDSTIRIPWILKAPGKAAGQAPRRFAPQVRLVDVLPTMIELADAGDPVEQPPQAAYGNVQVDGVSLVPYLAGGSAPELEAYAETFLPRNQFNWSELKAVRTPQLKYIEAPEPELYALTDDPAETRNVHASARESATRMQTMLSGLERAAAGAHALTAAGSRRKGSDIVDAEKFLALGYIGHSPASESTPGAQLPDPKRKIEVYQLVMSSLDLSEAGKPAEALDALRRAEQLDPGVTQSHYLKGVILGGQERYAEAAVALERAVALNPRHVLARFKLALAYLRLSRVDDAERALRTVLEDEPRNVRAIHNLAAIAYTRGDLARAEQLEQQALAIDRTYFEAWNTLGAIYVVLRRPLEAKQALDTAIALQPGSGQAHYNLALALRASGDEPAAGAAARKACTLDARYCR